MAQRQILPCPCCAIVVGRVMVFVVLTNNDGITMGMPARMFQVFRTWRKDLWSSTWDCRGTITAYWVLVGCRDPVGIADLVICRLPIVGIVSYNVGPLTRRPPLLNGAERCDRSGSKPGPPEVMEIGRARWIRKLARARLRIRVEAAGINFAGYPRSAGIYPHSAADADRRRV